MKSNLIKNKTLVLYLSFFTLLILVTGCASTPAKDNDTAAKKAPKSQGIVIQNGEYSIQYERSYSLPASARTIHHLKEADTCC